MLEGPTSPATDGSGKMLRTTDAPAGRRRWPGAVGVTLVVLVIAIAVIAAVTPSMLTTFPRINADTGKVAAAAIFAASYLALAIGKVPGLNIDRAGVALVGAGLMVASGALSIEDADKAIDLDTITVLLRYPAPWQARTDVVGVRPRAGSQSGHFHPCWMHTLLATVRTGFR